jgi:hypothetical protein
MRTISQIEKIKKTFQDPRVVESFLSDSDIGYLINLYESSDDLNSPYKGKIKKNTGPVTLDLTQFLSDAVVKNTFEKIEKEIGPYDIVSAFFFKTDYPHIIHNDDSFDLPDNVYRAITLPLALYGDKISGFPSLCFFEQFYFHGPSKFFKGEKFVPTYYNKQIYEYKDIDNLTDEPFDLRLYEKYFTHLKKDWLDGLTFHSFVDWIPGSAIIFDSVRLHCASDFRKLGIKEKLAISIFTKKK